MAKKDEKEFTIQDLPGVGAATAEKLISSGFDTMLSIAVASPGELVNTAGVTEAAARKIINTAREKLDMGFESGEELLKKREMVEKITTGSKNLDAMIGGGVETGAVTEVYGSYGSGKTSIAHQLAVTVQLPKEQGGADGAVVWIDSEGTLRPEFIKKLAVAKGLDPEQALKNFRGVRAFNSDHQMLLVDKIEELIKQGLNVKLVIVDSLTSHFRSEYTGRGTLADRQQKINKHIHALLKLANTYNVAVYITNQVMAKPDVFFGDPTEAIGGHVLHHACLTADSLIQLADGTITPIGDFREANVLTTVNVLGDLKQNASACIRGSMRNDIKEIYEIDTNYSIKASALHRFFVIRDFEIKEVIAEDLRKDDYIMTIRKLKINGKEQKLPKIETPKLITLTNETSELIKRELTEKKITRKQICEKLKVRPRQLRRVLNQEYATNKKNIELLVDQGLSQNLVSLCIPYTSNKFRDIELPENLSVEIAQILGYFIGDGCVDKSSLRFRDSRIEVLEIYKDLINKSFGFDGRITLVKGKNCYNLSINSVHLSELFMQLRKNIFSYISKSTDEHVRAFIKGFMDAEGHVSKRRARVTIGQKNKLTLQYIQMLLLRFGVRSNLRRLLHKDGRILYILLFDNKDMLKFGEEIGVSASDKKETLNKWMNNVKSSFNKDLIPISRTLVWQLLKDCNLYPSHYMKPRSESYAYTTRDKLQIVLDALQNAPVTNENLIKKIKFLKFLLNNDVTFEKVRSVKISNNKEPLYDLFVPFAENYVANCFVVHNSTYRIYLRRGKKGTRVAKLVDAPAMPENESIFIVTEKGIKDPEGV